MIRQAQPNDRDAVIPLILLASTCLFADALQSDDASKHAQLLATFYATPGTKFYYENIFVYTVADEVVGCIVAYPAADEAEQSKVMDAIVANGYHFAAEGLPETLYIDSLAVSPNHQGQGIATQLIRFLQTQTTSDLSLLVEAHKTAVKAYYERLGFQALPKAIYFQIDTYPMRYHNQFATE